jgi:hypothetical protein
MIALRPVLALTLALGLFVSTPLSALASPASDALGQCLVGETTGNDRVLLVRWMTYAFASHPAVQNDFAIDTSKIDQLNRDMAQLFTDLITQRCVDATKAAVAETGDPSTAISAAFEILGAAASQEVMQAPEVNGAIGGFTNYIDQAAFDGLLN